MSVSMHLARPVKLIVHMDSSRLWTVPPLSRTVVAYRLHERVVASYLTNATHLFLLVWQVSRNADAQ